MTNLAEYEQWDYRKVFKIDPCNCEDEENKNYILSVRWDYSLNEDGKRRKINDQMRMWVKVAILDNDLLVDLIKNCISTHESDGEYIDDRERLVRMLRDNPDALNKK